MRDINYNERLLVSRYQGSMPLVLTCPHGGDQQPLGVPKKRTGVNLPPGCRFETNTDDQDDVRHAFSLSFRHDQLKLLDTPDEPDPLLRRVSRSVSLIRMLNCLEIKDDLSNHQGSRNEGYGVSRCFRQFR